MATKLTKFKPIQEEVLKLRRENALLIEALEDILSWLREYETGYFVNEVSVIKAKELLNNLKKINNE